MNNRAFKGVLLSPVDTAVVNWSGLTRRGIPVVLVDRVAAAGNMCSVAVDDVLGVGLAAAHLVEQGHRLIAFAGGPISIFQVADRRHGATAAIKGKAKMIDVQTPSLTVDGGRAAGSQLARLSGEARPTAVFCANDLVALGPCKA